MKFYRYVVETIDHQFVPSDIPCENDLEARARCFDYYVKNPSLLCLLLFRYEEEVSEGSMILIDKITRPLSVLF